MTHIESVSITRVDHYAFVIILGLCPGAAGVGTFEVYNKMYKDVPRLNTSWGSSLSYTEQYHHFLRSL